MIKNEIVKLIVAFLSVRKVIALVVTITFCYIAIKGLINASEFISVFSMIIGFYFGRSTALDMPGRKDKEEGG
ncbi:hypothetical protein [Anaerospora hongkongensis]|uniref:hypothetical protein n=1 Tax=Anaerospora hongkongensis TaxID=244830 RepID=UPI00289E8E95|nr:hypothetical protein [Anaerospora hongkongensis]